MKAQMRGYSKTSWRAERIKLRLEYLKEWTNELTELEEKLMKQRINELTINLKQH